MEITTSIDIGAPADRVWEIIGPGFADVSTWATAIPTSTAAGVPRPDGAPCEGRVCRVAAAGFDQIVEELLDYDGTARSLTYRAAHGMPGFVTAARNAWSVRARPSGGAAFTMSAHVEVKGMGRFMAPFLRVYLQSIGRRTARDLRVYAETGQVSPSKERAARGKSKTSRRRLVSLNAIFSVTCGLALATAAEFWSRQFAQPGAALMIATGFGLCLWASALAWLVRRGLMSTQLRVIAALDGTWVLASIVLLAARGSAFTATGTAAVSVTAAAVGLLGWLQWRAVPSHTAAELR